MNSGYMKLEYTFQTNRNNIIVLLSAVLFLLFSGALNAQEYGLGFAGQPNSKDRRTQLDLNPGNYFSFSGEFELSFQLRIRKELPSTFGYVFRIVDQNNNNVDLIFNSPDQNSLQLVYSEQLTDIVVPYPDSAIYRGWTEVRLKVDLNKHSIEFNTSGTTLTEGNVPINGKVKILFGRNTFKPVQTTDVPTMDIKDIRIFKKEHCLHHYPLDELEGNIVKDLISNKEGLVQNPMWIRPDYYNWEAYFSTFLQGFVPYCYAPDEDKIYMVGERQMKVLSLRTDSRENLEYAERFTNLGTGSQVFYDSLHKKLYCYSHRTRLVYSFNFKDLLWEEVSDGPDLQVRLWYHNKLYSVSDSVLYTFGGYGQHRYYNTVLQYDFRLHQWDTVQTTGEVFYPRMHAALGSLGDTVYIMGGYGSTAGDQILNPRHYNDLLAFSLKEKKFIKKYDFEAPISDIDFAHSMVFDDQGESFYVLASSIYQYEAYLQLLKGSLSGPELVSMGTKIPYLYDNENSYSDLFYSNSLQKLIAVTSLANTEKGETDIKVYILAFPPYRTESGDFSIASMPLRTLWIVLVLILITGFLVFTLFRYRKKTNKSVGKKSLNEKSVKNSPEPESLAVSSLNGPKDPNSIIFFGGFQVINMQGEDITGKFTPLLKELFLLIFLYSVKDKGISVPRLTELLWFSMDAKSAKNNRAVNIAKLKHLLSEIESCTLSRKTEYWRLGFDETRVNSDYLSFYRLSRQGAELSNDNLEKLLRIVSVGPLLGNASYDWLDEFKLDCSDHITDVLLKYLDQEDVSIDPELEVRIADAILIFDMLHEEGIIIKCRALTELGKHNLAKEIFNKFSKDYMALYDEPYNKSFTDIIKQ